MKNYITAILISGILLLVVSYSGEKTMTNESKYNKLSAEEERIIIHKGTENSISLKFIAEKDKPETAKAYFAGGCFWGVEYLFEHKDGVLSAVSGYMGGHKDNPTYKEVYFT